MLGIRTMMVRFFLQNGQIYQSALIEPRAKEVVEAWKQGAPYLEETCTVTGMAGSWSIKSDLVTMIDMTDLETAQRRSPPAQPGLNPLAFKPGASGI